MMLFSYLLMSGITTGALYALVALGFVVVNKATGAPFTWRRSSFWEAAINGSSRQVRGRDGRDARGRGG